MGTVLYCYQVIDHDVYRVTDYRLELVKRMSAAHCTPVGLKGMSVFRGFPLVIGAECTCIADRMPYSNSRTCFAKLAT